MKRVFGGNRTASQMRRNMIGQPKKETERNERHMGKPSTGDRSRRPEEAPKREQEENTAIETGEKASRWRSENHGRFGGKGERGKE
ncbi:UNVERIFIED_CONTAM: hypothetical protein HHA_451880 [Hammondia hammondi]|eukprot:XP_008884867.1 hypothetical protein HHA_451880 [Hammondia hammondi]